MVDDSNIAFLNGCVYRQNIYTTSRSTHTTNNRKQQSLPHDPILPAASRMSNYSYGTVPICTELIKFKLFTIAVQSNRLPSALNSECFKICVEF
jgi:hypothetical protein